MITRTWTALGTTAVLVTAPAHADAAQAAVAAELDAVDRAASRFRTDSELVGLERAAGRRVPISPLLYEAIAVALQAAEETGGAVDPTLGPELVALGYDRDLEQLRPATPGAPLHAAQPRGERRAARWAEIELFGDPPGVRIPSGVRLDLGATAKALAADRCAQAALRATDAATLVALGGDIAVAGDPPADGWSVRIEENHRAAGDGGQLVQIQEGGLATSSITTRRWSHAGRTCHHILDPRTGSPITGYWRTASVVASTCAGANAASTAALVLGERAELWLRARGLPARLISRAGEISVLGGWPA